MNADGTGQARLADIPSLVGSMEWSPDGSRIVFSAYIYQSGESPTTNDEILVMNADGTRLTNLTNNPANDAMPTWSPDGKQIAFESSCDGRFAIYVMNADGTGVTRLTKGRWPAWSR